MGKEHKASIDGDQWAQCAREHGWLWDVASNAPSGGPITPIGMPSFSNQVSIRESQVR